MSKKKITKRTNVKLTAQTALAHKLQSKLPKGRYIGDYITPFIQGFGSKLLKGLLEEIIFGSIIGVIKGDTRSLDLCGGILTPRRQRE